MNNYEAKQEARRERLLARAERLEAQAQAANRLEHSILDVIPLGQPILVGHHSEKRHRRALARADQAMHRSRRLSDLAARCRARADSVGRAGISSDDPEAVEKLGTKTEQLEAKRDHMKAVNAAWRKLKALPDDAARLIQLKRDGVIPGEEAVKLAKFLSLCHWETAPYPSYALTNIGARIRQAKARAAELEQREKVREAIAAEQTEAPPDVTGPGWTIREDLEDNRLLVLFDAKPPVEVRTRLKRAGFRWSPTRGAWCRMLGNGARAAADYALKV